MTISEIVLLVLAAVAVLLVLGLIVLSRRHKPYPADQSGVRDRETR